MTLKERIESDMKAALLGGNRFVGDVLRNLKAAILNEEVAAGARDTGLSDAQVEKIIARELKRRQESIKMYADNNREDLAEPERKEAAVLQEYLPEQLTEGEIVELVATAIANTGATGPHDMGKVIGVVKSEAGNAVDGVLLAQIVKKQLTK